MQHTHAEYPHCPKGLPLWGVGEKVKKPIEGADVGSSGEQRGRPRRHSELAIPGRSHPFLKHHHTLGGWARPSLGTIQPPPGRHENKFYVYIVRSLLSIQWWELQHWSRKKGRHLPVIVGDMIPDSRVCSAASGNGPGDLLWDRINRRALEQEPWAHTGIHTSIITAKLANIH